MWRTPKSTRQTEIDPMGFDEVNAGGNLEQFTLLAKNARGRACVALIQQVLSNKTVFVFRELLDMPNVQALANTEHQGYLELLRIFCFGAYQDYLAQKTKLPELTAVQTHKLRKLTVVSLCQKSKMVRYDQLLTMLDLSTIRELEDLLIDTIYSGLIQAKLDQKSQCLAVKFAVGRDTQDSDIDAMIEKLVRWRAVATSLCSTLDEIMSEADQVTQKDTHREEQIRSKVNVRISEKTKLSPNSGNAFEHVSMAQEPTAFVNARRNGPMPSKQRFAGRQRRTGRN